MLSQGIKLALGLLGGREAKQELDGVRVSMEQVRKSMAELNKPGLNLSSSAVSAEAKETLSGAKKFLSAKKRREKDQKTLQEYLDAQEGGGSGIGALARKFVQGRLSGSDVAQFAMGGSAVYGAAALAAIGAATKVTDSILQNRNAKTGKVEWTQVGDQLAGNVPGYGLIKNVHELLTGYGLKTEQIKSQAAIQDLVTDFTTQMHKAIRQISQDLSMSLMQSSTTRQELGFGDQVFSRNQAAIINSGELEKAQILKDTNEAKLKAKETLDATLKQLYADPNLTHGQRAPFVAMAKRSYDNQIAALDASGKARMAEVDPTTQAKLKEQQRAATKALQFFNRDQEQENNAHWSALRVATLSLMGANRQAELETIRQKYDEQILATTVKYDEMKKTVSDQQAAELEIKKQGAIASLELQRKTEQEQLEQRRQRVRDEEGRNGTVGENLLRMQIGTTFDRAKKAQLQMQQQALGNYKELQAAADAVLSSKSATAEEKDRARAMLKEGLDDFERNVAEQNPLGPKRLASGTEMKAATGVSLAGRDWDAGTREDYNKQLLGQNQQVKQELEGIKGVLTLMYQKQLQAANRYAMDSE